MSPENQLRLTKSRTGRIILHLLTVSRDHKMRWHLRGMMHEIKEVK